MRELIALYLLSLVWTVGLTLLQDIVAFLASYTLVLVALFFVYMPLEMLAKRHEEQADYGIHLRNPIKSIKWFAIASAIVFPLYFVGYHCWQTMVQDRTLEMASARFARWPVEMDGLVRTSNGVSLAVDGREIVVQWHDLEGSLTIEADRDLTQKNGQGKVQDNIYSSLDRKTGFARLKHNGDTLLLSAPAKQVFLGRFQQPAALPYKAHRSPWWFLTALLTQLFLIAMPEELFYRGYIQGRLDRLIGRTRTFWGVQINVTSIIVTSTLFALGHIATIQSPARLAVFFPSILFGVLRCISGSILTPILFHASCNLAVEVLFLLYV